MPKLTLTFEYQTDEERLALEQAAGYLRDMSQLARTAEHGTVIAACEQLALTAGRQLLRDHLGAALQARADATDALKKSPAPATKGPGPDGF